MQMEKQLMMQLSQHLNLKPAQQGKTLTVKITPNNAKGTGKTVESAPTKAVDTLPKATNVKIIGTFKIGCILTATYDYYRCKRR